MPTVHKQPDRTCWNIDFTDQHGQRRRVNSKMKDRRAAERLANLIERDVERLRGGLPPLEPDLTAEYLGLANPKGPTPWAEAVEAYLAELVRRGNPADGPTVSEGRRLLTLVGQACGWKHLAAVRAADFSHYLAGMTERGRAPRTLNRYHETLRAFLNWCVEPQGWLDKNPSPS
jgi:hypothetical protein